jgi:hypothetical protein
MDARTNGSVNSHENTGKTMMTVSMLALFEAKPGNQIDVERFLNQGRPISPQYQASTFWYAFRLSPTRFGAFAAFVDEEVRDALLNGGGPALAERHNELLAVPPVFKMADVLAAKLPGEGNSVKV